MKDNSIEKTLPRMARLMILILIVLILPANMALQFYIQHQNQKQSSKEIFWQMEQLIRNNAYDVQREKREFSRQCIRSARMAAYFVEHYPEHITDLEHTRELAEVMDVDEIHFITPQGKICAGTHPEYYGLGFDSGDQMRFFLPMLENTSLELCQEITPNTAEGKPMQYAAVWMKDKSGILQIGMEPERLLKQMEEKSLRKVVSEIPSDLTGYLHIVNMDTGKVEASTSTDMIGTDLRRQIRTREIAGDMTAYHYRYGGRRYCVYNQKYGQYLLVRSFISAYPLHSVIQSTILVFIYIFGASMAVLWIIMWYMKVRLADNLTAIVGELKKIEDGNINNLEIHTGILEFDELVQYVNELLKSIRLNWDKMNHVIENSRVPMGIFEYNQFYKKTFMNGRIRGILGISGGDSSALVQEVKDRLEQIEKSPVDKKESIYSYERNGETVFVRIEKLADEQSTTWCVTDVSLWWKELNLLREQSSRDSLTMLYNRRGFSEHLEALFAAPQSIGTGVMIMLDADGLKGINDIYGHRMGDAYLRQIGSQIEFSGENRFVSARMGGDEFCAFLYGYSSREEAKEVLKDFESRRGEAFMDPEMRNVLGTVEFSVGYAFYPDDGTDYHVLMHISDERMYEEKKRRKGRGTGRG